MGLRNQALEARGTQGGRILGEPGARAGPDKPPVALVPSKNPFRQSLIGEINPARPQLVITLKFLSIYYVGLLRDWEKVSHVTVSGLGEGQRKRCHM